MNDSRLSQTSLRNISRIKYEENRAVVDLLYPKIKEIGKGKDTYYQGSEFVFIDKNECTSKLVLSKEARKCQCGCELWDYTDAIKMIPQCMEVMPKRARILDIVLLLKTNIAETSQGRRKLTYEMHPKFYEILEGSLEALLQVNLGERK